MTVHPVLRHSRRSDGDWCIEAEIWVPQPRDKVFAFFQDAHNLEALTPDFLQFEVITAKPIAMHQGTLIDYRIRLHGLPIRWRTEIQNWDPPFGFVDAQRKGPYRRWHHTHRFIEKDGGTLCTDRVLYSVFGGKWVQALFVHKDVEAIFHYRTEQIRKRFG